MQKTISASVGETPPPSGQIAAPPTSTDTLDEPIVDTLLRDAKLIGTKLRYVLIPAGSRNELKNWDLWGPLILCLLLSVVLSLNDPGQASYKFSIVFAIVWFGAALATMNALLLGGNISVFQSVCVLGYCMFPLNIASLVLQFVSMSFLRLIAVSVAFFWSSRASLGFMSPLVPEGRKALGVYPVILFYITIAWMVIIS